MRCRNSSPAFGCRTPSASRGGHDSSKDCLDAFNIEVQKQLAPSMVQNLGGSGLPFSYTIYMVGACGLPYISNVIPSWLIKFRSGLGGYELFVWTLRQLMDCAIVSISAVFAVRTSLELWKVGVRMQKYKCFRSRTLLVAILSSAW